MTNSADPDQLASDVDLHCFAKTGHIQRFSRIWPFSRSGLSNIKHFFCKFFCLQQAKRLTKKEVIIFIHTLISLFQNRIVKCIITTWLMKIRQKHFSEDHFFIDLDFFIIFIYYLYSYGQYKTNKALNEIRLSCMKCACCPDNKIMIPYFHWWWCNNNYNIILDYLHWLVRKGVVKAKPPQSDNANIQKLNKEFWHFSHKISYCC